jgi:hypothetical protein
MKQKAEQPREIEGKAEESNGGARNDRKTDLNDRHFQSLQRRLQVNLKYRLFACLGNDEVAEEDGNVEGEGVRVL